MNSKEFTSILLNPSTVNKKQTDELEQIIDEYPYFQSARAIYLKGLKNQDSFKYNKALKITASATADRNILFNFITSDQFNNSNQSVANLTIVDEQEAKSLHQDVIKKQQEESTKSIENFEFLNDTVEVESKAKAILEIGKPISFNTSEKHSFNEWMQLTSFKPIFREVEKESISNEKDKKFDLIDQFIKQEPKKIKPVEKSVSHQSDLSNHFNYENDLMTETLAKVYLEQKKYDNAIKAYHILSLKYPEKSGFFADRIKAIKILSKK